MGHARRALIVGFAALPALVTASTAVPKSLPALEIELVDEPIHLRASEIKRAMNDPEGLSQVIYAFRNRWISGICVVWCARDGAGKAPPSICGCRL